MSNLTTYTVTAPQLDGELIFKFDVDGILREWNNDVQDMNEKVIRWFSARHPMLERWMMGGLVLKCKEELGISLNVQKKDIDLSFENFWSFYGYKIGKKYQAQRIWEGDIITANKRPMNDTDRLTCFRTLARMKYHYKLKSTSLPYPEVYLRNRRWEDEY